MSFDGRQKLKVFERLENGGSLSFKAVRWRILEFVKNQQILERLENGGSLSFKILHNNI